MQGGHDDLRQLKRQKVGNPRRGSARRMSFQAVICFYAIIFTLGFGV